MVEIKDPQRANENKTPTQPVEDPGLMESFGTFPVWMLKIIQLFTPDCLINKTPPEKKKTRI